MPVLSVVVFLPLLGAILVTFLPRSRPDLPKKVALGIALLDLSTGQILEVNARYVEIFGGTRESITRLDWMSITSIYAPGGAV